MESDILEYKKLAGWDSGNFYTLNSTVKKFQKKIY